MSLGYLCACKVVKGERKKTKKYYIKHVRQCFITFPNTEKRVGNTTHGGKKKKSAQLVSLKVLEATFYVGVKPYLQRGDPCKDVRSFRQKILDIRHWRYISVLTALTNFSDRNHFLVETGSCLEHTQVTVCFTVCSAYRKILPGTSQLTLALKFTADLFTLRVGLSRAVKIFTLSA